jgi:hypothetical protein
MFKKLKIVGLSKNPSNFVAPSKLVDRQNCIDTSRSLARRRCKIFWNLRRLVSVEVSMNTTRPLRKILPATRNGLRSAGEAMNPSELGGELGKCEQIKDLAAMRYYEGWQRDCTMMLDLL